jgi:peptidyl-tRNA hydrolase, PTH1 family
MGLFQRRPIIGDNAPLYTTGMQKTLLIVGLGNIGKDYEGTRHNIGFDVIDHFAEKQGFPGWTVKKDLFCAETSHTLGSARVILCKPTTFMNESGKAVQAMQRFYKIANSSTLVVHDELDIDYGQIRTRLGGGAAGNNGIKSLIQNCGEDFGRVRIGIGPKKPAQIESADFVLSKFSSKEKEQLSLLRQETNSILSEYCYGNGELITETRTFIL